MAGSLATAFPSYCAGTRFVRTQFPYGSVGADLARREELDPRDAPGPPIEDDVDAAERLAAREGLDDADAVDLMREPGVRVTGGDDVHQPVRQASRDPKDLRLGLARRQIRGPIESLAAPARVRGDDDDVGAGRSKLRRLRGDRRPERRDPQSLNVGGEGRLQRVDRHDADNADLDPGRLARAPMAGRSATRPAGPSPRRSGSPRERDIAPGRRAP